MESIKHKNEIDQTCIDSPDLKHCWHSEDGNSLGAGMQENSTCCWCGIKVQIHGKFKPVKVMPMVKY